ncbi:MAG: formate dehydrogenase subunit delta [Sterolibacteriaceae bacterium]|uniref:formate dehydrogenase subunit delta n=1 Tax=Sulfuritalea sp. TaxID=2480090 RepID=UPI001A3AF808|nr:formate dehydrogenase subunit delta [Sulfuritalea sp.]MBL8479694.1 formate dehydrogenase subunit delta [Sterolibacteriaceae bacterium]MBN8476346.1 formate dehydrogenase subunit delta [Sulfuritalea sp.]
MNLEKLIAMANQIGAFFEAMPDREQAVADVASHLKRSWDPRMRQQILASLGTADEARLKPLVREALRRL